MAKKRKQRRISTALNDDRAEDLIGGIYSLMTGKISTDKLFDSDLQRRAVYFANKEKLIDRALEENGAGSRPDAFYKYETDLDSDCEIDRHEYLINNSLLFDGEHDALIARYLFILEPNKLSIKHHREWERSKQFERQAHVYGGAALEAWQQFAAEMEAE